MKYVFPFCISIVGWIQGINLIDEKIYCYFMFEYNKIEKGDLLKAKSIKF
jgi:hypothetical protein